MAELIKLDWHTIKDVMARAVQRGLVRRDQEPVRNLGLDEKSFGSGQSYASVLTDIRIARGFWRSRAGASSKTPSACFAA